VPVNTAKEVLSQLKQGGEVQRAYLGVEMADVNEQIADDLNLPAKEGALIQSAVEGGPADDAGLRGGRTPTSEGAVAGGDLIVAIDGKPVKGSEDVADAISSKKPGDEVTVEYYRDDDKKSAKVKLGKRPATLQQSNAPELP
jgi:S1-C subfamily serine protease